MTDTVYREGLEEPGRTLIIPNDPDARRLQFLLPRLSTPIPDLYLACWVRACPCGSQS